MASSFLNGPEFITGLREEMRAELAARHDALPRLDWLQIAERREGNGDQVLLRLGEPPSPVPGPMADLLLSWIDKRTT